MKVCGSMTAGAIVTCAVVAFSLNVKAAESLPRATREDAKTWRQIYPYQLTPDGRWLVYAAGPIGMSAGDVSVILRSTQDATERRYVAGAASLGAGSLRVSPSGAWAGFLVAPEEAATAGKPAELDAALIHIESGTRQDFKAVRAFEFLEGGETIVLQGYPSTQGDNVFPLAIRALDSDRAQTAGGVTEYAVNQQRTSVAWAAADGIRVYDSASGKTAIIESAPGPYQALTWSERGNALAALRTGKAGAEYVIVTGLNTSKPHRSVLGPQSLPAFPDGYGLTASLRWREDERGLFLGIRALPKTALQSPTVPYLSIWHWRDELTPPERKRQASKRQIDWCFVSLADKRLVRLTDSKLRDIELYDRGRFVIGYDLSPYGWMNKLAATTVKSQSRDYYTIDLSSGARKLLVRDLRVASRPRVAFAPVLSPDGRVLVYRDNHGDYIAHELNTARRRNLTAHLGHKFYLDENDPKTDRQLVDVDAYPLQGWSVDGAHVLISDYRDIWALPLRGGSAVNLTRDGVPGDVWYQLADLSDPSMVFAPRAVDLRGPLHFYASDRATGMRGLVRRTPGQHHLETLRWEYAEVRYLKAQRAETYVYSRETFIESRDLYLAGKDWQPGEKLTDVNPQQRAFRSSPPAKYLTYRTSRGDVRHAVLFLPVNYVDGQAYPTIVHIYRQLSHALHRFQPPYPQGNPELHFLQQGYSVLFPDIVPRLDEAGQAALDDVTAAVDAAVATGTVKRDALGLLGHSFGGYLTNFIISQTDLFNAAVSIAGPTNLWSSCGGMHGEMPASPKCEMSQPFLSEPSWSGLDAYLRNSPLYHARNIRGPLLLIHGDNDVHVPFTQSLELFNTLRRMGDRQVVLLQYAGADHNVKRPDADIVDPFERIHQFFDHFLKGEEPPAWWSEGISYPVGEVPTGSPTMH